MTTCLPASTRLRALLWLSLGLAACDLSKEVYYVPVGGVASAQQMAGAGGEAGQGGAGGEAGQGGEAQAGGAGQGGASHAGGGQGGEAGSESLERVLRLGTLGGHVTASGKLLPLGQAARTVEVWIRADPGLGTERFVVSWGELTPGGGWMLGLENGLPVITQIGASIKGPAPLDDGAWHHLAVAFTPPNKYSLYTDTKLAVTGSMPTDTQPGSLAVGRSIEPETKWFAGDVDEVRIWTVTRTAEELAASAKMSLSGSEPGLILYWDMTGPSPRAENRAVAASGAAGGDLRNNAIFVAGSPF